MPASAVPTLAHLAAGRRAEPLRDLEATLGAALVRDLENRGVLRVETARTSPCGAERDDCARTVVGDPDRLDRVRAVCEHAPPGCAPLLVLRRDLREASVSREALAAHLAELLRLEPAAREGLPRGVFVCGARGTATSRTTFVLVALGPLATSRALVDLASRAGDALVALVLAAEKAPPGIVTLALADVLSVKDGRLVAALPRAFRLRGAPVSLVQPGPAPAALAVPAGTRWEDVYVQAVDDQSILVRIGRSRQRLTYVDAGMALPRTREPTRQWLLLQLLCRTRGTLTWTDADGAKGVKMRVSRLRDDLRRLFGIEGDPFHRYRTGVGYRVKFACRSGE